jgi:hypothetical protein
VAAWPFLLAARAGAGGAVAAAVSARRNRAVTFFFETGNLLQLLLVDLALCCGVWRLEDVGARSVFASVEAGE